MEPRIVDGVKVVEVAPDAPLPPGVPSWAERCEVTETNHFSPAKRPWAIAAGALGALGSIALMTLTGWGVAFLGMSLALLYHALTNTTPTVVPSPSGRYLAFDDGTPCAESGMDVARRYATLVFGVMIIVGAGMALYYGGVHRVSMIGLGAFGCYLFYQGVKGPDPRDEPLGQRTPLRFHALADPARPLTAGDPISISPDNASTAAPAASGDGN